MSDGKKEKLMLRLITSKMDVYSVQSHAEEILYALNGLEKIEIPANFVLNNLQGAPLLFTGLETRFVLNDAVIPVNFSTCLFYQGSLGNEKEGRFIKFMDGSTFSEDTQISDELFFKKGDILDESAIKSILAAKNIKYIENADSKEYRPESKVEARPLNQEIWFARDNIVMEEALATVQSKDIIYYPDVNGKLKIVWHTFKMSTVIYELRILGLFMLDDKVVLRTLPEFHDSIAIANAMRRGTPNTFTTYEPLIFTRAWFENLEAKGFNVYRASGLPDLITNHKDINPSIWNG